MAKAPASPSALKRESAGRYVSGDGRFVVEQASGGWMVSDTEQANELGLPLVRGPFATLADARAAAEAAREGPAPVSDLAARMAALPPATRREPAGRGAGRSARRASGAAEVAAAKPPRPERRAAEPPRVVTRDWQPGDGDGLRGLWSSIGMGSLGDDDAGLAAMAERNPGLLRVAVAGDEIVGSALGAWDGRRGWIYHVATAPGRRRQGIGRRLLTEVEDRLRAVGCPKVNVMVLDGADEAAAFWTAAGYTRLDARQYGRALAAGASRGRR
jgi:ribosomal protein S18 acetylase RimI-like enzyme